MIFWLPSPSVEQLLKKFSTSEKETINGRNHENETFRENNRKCFRDANMSQNCTVGKNQILVSDWLLEQAHLVYFVPASQLRKSPRDEVTCCKKRINTCREIPQPLGDWITIFFFRWVHESYVTRNSTVFKEFTNSSNVTAKFHGDKDYMVCGCTG